jgi:uncharacterized protein (DUF305 family)
MVPERSPRPAARGRFVAAGLVAALVLGGGGFAIGRLTAPVVSAPSTTSAEAGFARDMQEHHNQAVEMAYIVRDATDDADVRLLALDIATAQSQQSGQMFGWLTVWNLPQTASEPSMTWMSRPPITGGGHAHTAEPDAGATEHTPGGDMPGMATREQLAELRSLTGTDAERLFLTLMIAHHRGGVEMAEAVLERTDERVVRDFATGVVTAQSGEIDYMQDLLDALPAP